MSEYVDKAFQIMEQNAEMSGNKQAFIEGVVYGLGHGHVFIEQHEHPKACIQVLIDMIDEKYFKPLETSPN